MEEGNDFSESTAAEPVVQTSSGEVLLAWELWCSSGLPMWCFVSWGLTGSNLQIPAVSSAAEGRWVVKAAQLV